MSRCETASYGPGAFFPPTLPFQSPCIPSFFLRLIGGWDGMVHACTHPDLGLTSSRGKGGVVGGRTCQQEMAILRTARLSRGTGECGGSLRVLLRRVGRKYLTRISPFQAHLHPPTCRSRLHRYMGQATMDSRRGILAATRISPSTHPGNQGRRCAPRILASTDCQQQPGASPGPADQALGGTVGSIPRLP